MKHSMRWAIATAALFAACDNTSVAPDSAVRERGPVLLRLTASIADATIAIGDTTQMVVQVHNDGRDTVKLTFSTTCQTNAYITAADDELVYPRGGGWGCGQMLTFITIPPGEFNERRMPVWGTASASDEGLFALEPGQYKAYARLQHRDYPLVSPVVEFAVR
ncbi:MAG TPA: BsuPI-related putative proteinase inhibitor [Gemmatimonadaceae bacterium]|nr:BsuPI-related putative proteinase inhibitor [Gemmatimonadaceae bacterium]